MFDEILASLQDNGALPDGWTGWVCPERLRMMWPGKTRPWCRGRTRGDRVEWIPRTTKEPFGDERFVVCSPRDELRGINEPGFWICESFVEKTGTYDPQGDEIGTLPGDVLEAFERCLEGLYWRSQ